MSTRSGKRIHGSLYENIAKTDAELAPKSERKTRSKLLKENLQDPSTIVQKLKKRENYVTYPTDDEQVDDTANLNENESKHTRTLRKNALQEYNPPILLTETSECEVPQKTVRSTRRTRKFVEIAAGDIENVEIDSSEALQKKTKKSKRKKISSEIAEAQQKTGKKKNKKKGKRSNSFATENETGDVIVDINIANINNSNVSIDSFHSAAGSPIHEDVIACTEDAQLNTNEIIQPKKFNSKTKKILSKPKSIEKLISEENDISENKNGTFEIDKPRRKSSIKAGIDQTDSVTRISKSHENISDTVVSHKNDTYDMEQETGKKKKPSIKSIGFNDSVTKIRKLDANVSFPKDNEKKNATFEIEPKMANLSKSSIKNASFDASVMKIRKSDANISLCKDDQNKNDTFDMEQETGKKKKLSIKSIGQNDSETKIQKSDANVSFPKDNEMKNDTFEIEPKMANLDKSNIKNDSFNVSVTKARKSNKNISVSKDDQNENDTFDMAHETGKKKKLSIKSIGLNDSETKIQKSDANVSFPKNNEKKNDTFDIEPNTANLKKSSIKNASFDASVTKIRKTDANISVSNDNQYKNDTFDIEPRKSSAQNESVPNLINTTFERESVGSASKSRKRKSITDISIKTLTSLTDVQTEKIPSLNSTYDKAETSVKLNSTDFDNKKKKSTLDITFEKETGSPKAKSRKSGNLIRFDRKSKDSIKSPMPASLNVTCELTSKVTENLNNTFDRSEKINTTFDKDQNLNSTFDKFSKSLISSDSNNDDISRISITSDESMTEPTKKPATIMNTTPVLIDSSIEDSLISEESKTEVTTPLRREGTFSLEESKSVIVPLKREGTFTKDGPDDPCVNRELSAATPKKNASLPSPGCTPHPTKSSTKKPLLNVTRSIEKTQCILEAAPRITRVMFCSPVNNPVVVAQQKRTVIKSNLKGSNKSFVYEEIVDTPPVRPSGRKRSFTHSEADEAHVKRKRLTDDIRQSVDRLSRPRTSSANAKLDSTPSKKSTTPSKAKVSRTKLPNFAALHQKQFEKMESLDECQERKAKRARQLLTPVPSGNPDKSSPKVPDSPKEQPKELVKKVDTLAKSFSQEASKPSYTRFGFKLNLDVNPFSIPSQNPKKNPTVLKRQATLPSLTGATSVRREVAKQVVMREKSFSDKRSLKRNENRTIIKGVRTNRRFELQMKLRNME